MGLGMVLAGEEHQQAALDSVLDAFDHRRHTGQTEQGADAEQGHYRVRTGFSRDASPQLGIEVSDELRSSPSG